MDELISQISEQFGLEPDASRSVVGKLVEMFTSQFEDSQRNEILSKLAGAEESWVSAETTSKSNERG